jgi:hypothetical protein
MLAVWQHTASRIVPCWDSPPLSETTDPAGTTEVIGCAWVPAKAEANRADGKGACLGAGA